MEKKLAIGITFLLLLGFILALANGIPEGEKKECLGWQKQAAEYSGFYLTKWQAAQCQNYKIQINAPVK